MSQFFVSNLFFQKIYSSPAFLIWLHFPTVCCKVWHCSLPSNFCTFTAWRVDSWRAVENIKPWVRNQGLMSPSPLLQFKRRLKFTPAKQLKIIRPGTNSGSSISVLHPEGLTPTVEWGCDPQLFLLFSASISHAFILSIF